MRQKSGNNTESRQRINVIGQGISTSFPIALAACDLILSAVEGSGGTLKFEDFTPLPCGDPNCATIGYLLKTDEGTRSISEFVDFKTLQGFLGDRIRYRLEDLARCGCESEPLGQLLHDLEMDERSGGYVVNAVHRDD